MRTVTTITEVRAVLDGVRRQGNTVGLVPTMGALHAGHASLMDRAADECDVVTASLFVNPLQFTPEEDLASYPQDPAGDAQLAEDHGVDVLFRPAVAEMFGEAPLTTVSVAELTDRFEGASRPTHFAGVTTVVCKLCNIAGPCRAYFGEKDWQQLVVVTRMIRDLSFPVDVVGCATVREPDGLALSSRNTYLGAEARAAAPVIRRSLQAGADSLADGERDGARVRALMVALIEVEPLARLDYVDVVRADDLVPVERLHGELRLLAAVRFGPTRLIDNLGVTV
ncbi:MAG: pantoate--beta-alanine ligase [Acidimicrobiales bacterium]